MGCKWGDKERQCSGDYWINRYIVGCKLQDNQRNTAAYLELIDT